MKRNQINFTWKNFHVSVSVTSDKFIATVSPSESALMGELVDVYVCLGCEEGSLFNGRTRTVFHCQFDDGRPCSCPRITTETKKKKKKSRLGSQTMICMYNKNSLVVIAGGQTFAVTHL